MYCIGLHNYTLIDKDFVPVKLLITLEILTYKIGIPPNFKMWSLFFEDYKDLPQRLCFTSQKVSGHNSLQHECVKHRGSVKTSGNDYC